MTLTRIQLRQRFWRENLDADRQWIPWDRWCVTEFLQKRNDTIVSFFALQRYFAWSKGRIQSSIYAEDSVIWQSIVSTKFNRLCAQLGATRCKRLFKNQGSSISSQVSFKNAKES